MATRKELEDLIEAEMTQKTKEKRISVILNYSSILIAVVGAIVASSISFDNLFSPDKNTLQQDSIAKINIIKLQNEILKVNNQLNKSLIMVDSLRNTEMNSQEARNLKIEITSLKTEVDNLNKVILDNPEKAISIPILKVQLENEKEQNEGEIKSIKEEIARVYDMNKWIIGLVFTMLVSIVVLNISNLYAKNKKDS